MNELVTYSACASIRDQRSNSCCILTFDRAVNQMFLWQDIPAVEQSEYRKTGDVLVHRRKRVTWVDNRKNAWLLWNYIYTSTHVRTVSQSDTVSRESRHESAERGGGQVAHRQPRLSTFRQRSKDVKPWIWNHNAG